MLMTGKDYRQEEAGAASDPAGAVKRGPTTRHDAVDMRVVLQGLAPGVENHGHAELGAEMPGIGCDGGKCLGRRAEQDRVNGGFVLERDLAERCRQREDDMKVRHRQQLGLPIREPFCPGQSLALGTVAGNPPPLILSGGASFLTT
jgi:hypothetical protein